MSANAAARASLAVGIFPLLGGARGRWTYAASNICTTLRCVEENCLQGEASVR
jgi:hypothetical protein